MLGSIASIVAHMHLVAKVGIKSCTITSTVKPLNNNRYFTVTERLPSLRGKIVLPWSCRDHRTCPL